MKKKSKNILIGVSIVAVVILIVYLSYGNYAVVGSGHIENINANFVSQDGNGATYQMTFSNTNSLEFGCNTDTEGSWAFQLTNNEADSQKPAFIPNLQTETWFDATPSISGIRAFVSPCSESPRGVAVNSLSSTAQCKIVPSTIVNGVQKALLTCRFSGSVYPTDNGINTSASFSAIQDGSAIVKIPFIGIPPPCSTGQNLCPDGTCKTDCNEPPQPPFPIMPIIYVIVGIAFVIVLILVWVKTR